MGAFSRPSPRPLLAPMLASPRPALVAARLPMHTRRALGAAPRLSAAAQRLRDARFAGGASASSAALGDEAGAAFGESSAPRPRFLPLPPAASFGVGAAFAFFDDFGESFFGGNAASRFFFASASDAAAASFLAFAVAAAAAASSARALSVACSAVTFSAAARDAACARQHGGGWNRALWAICVVVLACGGRCRRARGRLGRAPPPPPWP